MDNNKMNIIEKFKNWIVGIVQRLYIKPEKELLGQGHAYYEKGQIDDALSFFNQAIQTNSKFAEAYNYRGYIYKVKGEYDLALADYTKVIELNPNNAHAYIDRANVYREQKDYDRALSDYNKAIKLHIDIINVYEERASTYDEKGEYDFAVKDYTILIKRIKNYPWNYIRRGIIYYKQKKYDESLDDFNQAIYIITQKNKGYISRGYIYALHSAYFYRGNIYLQQKKYDLALTDYNNAIELNQFDYDNYYLKRGDVYKEKNDYQLALADYDKAIEINPDNADAYLNRGVVYLEKKQEVFAITDLLKYCELNKNDPLSITLLFTSRILAGDFSVSDTNVESILNNITLNKSQKQQIALFIQAAYLSANQFSSARKYVEKAFKDYKEEVFHKKTYLDNINNTEELYNKKQELEKTNAELLAAKKRLQKLVSSYNHTIGNTLFPHTLYEVAEKLKQYADFKPDALILLDCYRAEIFMRHQSELLQLKHAAQDAQAFRDKITLSRLPSDTSDPASTLRGILNQSLERVIARFLNEHYAKLQAQRDAILQKTGKSLKQLRSEFEEQVFFDKQDPLQWANDNLFLIEITEFSPAWEQVRLIPHSAAEAVLFGYFAELFYNVFKYSDYQRLALRCLEYETDGRAYLLSIWENTYRNNATPSGSGNGLSGMVEDLKMLNESDAEQETIETEDDSVNKIFRAKLYLRKDLFLSLSYEEHWR